VKLRVGSRDDLGAFRSLCDENDLDLHVILLYDRSVQTSGQFAVTAKQRGAFVRALELELEPLAGVVGTDARDAYFEPVDPAHATGRELVAFVYVTYDVVVERVDCGYVYPAGTDQRAMPGSEPGTLRVPTADD
jgi:hypothetical protein